MYHSTYFINLHPNEYSQELHYYSFVVNLDRRVGSCNTLNDLSNKVCVPNKREDLNLNTFNMITGIYESKLLTKHLSCKCKCKFNGRKCNSNQKWKNNKCWCECKKHHICEKDYTWNPDKCSCQNGKYLASITDYSVIMFDEIIDAEAKSYDEETKTVKKNQSVKQKKLYILLAFLLITFALLIAACIYYYQGKYSSKQKRLLPFHVTNDKLTNVL